MRALIRKISVRANYNFKMHLDKTGYNLPVMIDFINELQKEIFLIEYFDKDNEKGNRIVKRAKNRFYFDMDKQIEDFRTKIYHCAPEYQEEIYVFNRII